MRFVSVLTLVSISVLVFVSGCVAPSKSKPAAPLTRTTPAEPTIRLPGHREAFTAENNPTTLAGRGEPSLDDQFRPAAWVYIDGKKGSFTDLDGNPQLQWVIEQPVSGTPTFRVEAYEPLVGTPKDFRCVVTLQDSTGGSSVVYSYLAVEGTFELGREYSLVEPGENFAVRNRVTGDAVAAIPPLIPGTYLMAAGVLNRETGADTLAVTYFTVAE